MRQDMRKVCLVHGPYYGDNCPHPWKDCASGQPKEEYIKMILAPSENVGVRALAPERMETRKGKR